MDFLGLKDQAYGAAFYFPITALHGLDPKAFQRGDISGPGAALVGEIVATAALGAVVAEAGAAAGPEHHIVSRYSNAGRGWQRNWSELARGILGKAKIGVESEANKVRIPGHQGPHPELYHQRVFERLNQARINRGAQPLGDAIRQELQRIAEELRANSGLLSGIGL